MKKYLVLLILLIAAPSFAFGPAIQALVSSGGSAAPATFCTSATATTGGITGLLCEDFEGATECYTGYSSNCRAAFSAPTGTPDFDNAAAPGPIAGSYSTLLGGFTDAADTRISRTFTPTGGQAQELYFEMMLLEDDTTPGAEVVAALRRDTSTYCYLYIGADRKLGVKANATVTYTTDAIDEDTRIYVFLRYLHGSGADGVCTVGWSTDGTRPTSGTKYAESTDGTGTTDCNNVWFNGEYTSDISGKDVLIDNILVDDATIASNPI